MIVSLAEPRAAGWHAERPDYWLHRVAEIVLAAAIISLFVPFRVELGFTKVRPFDVFALLLLGTVLVQSKRLPAPTFWTGFVIVIPYLLWHVMSAFLVATTNGVREALQIGLVIVFAFSTYVLLPVLRFRRVGSFLLAGMAIVTAYNVYYHLSIGKWFGWKTLGSSSTGDVKYTFQFLPAVVGMFLLFGRRRLNWLAVLWAVLGVVIVCSGERKALLAYGLLTIAFVTRARPMLALPLLAAVVAVGSFVSSRLDEGYMAIQLNSVTNYSDLDQDRFDMIVRGAGPSSLSDSQRIFAFHVGKEMLGEHWLLGVGTNAYQDHVRREFAYAPTYVQLGIHGEFWRVLVENGVVGFVLYVLVWLVGVFRLTAVLAAFCRAGVLEGHVARLSFLLVLLPVGFSVAFEAAGTHAFVALLVASFSPELAYYSLRTRARRSGSLERGSHGVAVDRMRALSALERSRAYRVLRTTGGS